MGGDGFIIALSKRKPGKMRDMGGGSDRMKSKKDDMAEEGGEESGDDYSSVESDALDSLADVLQVDDADRDKFDSAIKDMIEACVKRALDDSEA